jgi:hypothetical protein
MVYTRGTQQISGSKPRQNCGSDWSPKTGSREGAGKIFTLLASESVVTLARVVRSHHNASEQPLYLTA